MRLKCSHGPQTETEILGATVATGILHAVRRWSIILLCCACATSRTEPEPKLARSASAEPLSAGRGGRALSRAAVVEVVNQGLGAFLQRVELEPSLSEGRFQGFRIVGLRPESYWQRVDLELGDVVTHVNGRSIERPDDAWEVFESLKQAPQLRVDLLRNGERHQLALEIVGEPLPEPKDATQPSPEAEATPEQQ